jgi:hypothetical protein
VPAVIATMRKSIKRAANERETELRLELPDIIVSVPVVFIAEREWRRSAEKESGRPRMDLQRRDIRIRAFLQIFAESCVCARKTGLPALFD